MEKKNDGEKLLNGRIKILRDKRGAISGVIFPMGDIVTIKEKSGEVTTGRVINTAPAATSGSRLGILAVLVRPNNGGDIRRIKLGNIAEAS